MPAASSGASSPLSAASTASWRTAVIRTLIEIGPSLRASRATRQAVTVAFVNPAGRGASAYQAINSSNPRLYTRRVIGDDTLSSTSAFNLRHSEALSATTKAFIVKSFCPSYLAISGANRTLALDGRIEQVFCHASQSFSDGLRRFAPNVQ